MSSLKGFGDIMGISDRIESSVENWRVKWGTALHNFSVNVVRWGLETLMDILGQALAPKLTPFIEELEATGKVPPELQPLLNEIKAPTGQVASMLAMTAGGSVIGGAITKVIDAMFNPLGYAAYRARPNLMPDLTQLLSLWLRGHVKEEDMPYFVSSLGYHPDMVKMWEDLSQIRLDPATITALYRRDKVTYEKLWEDLKHQGWTPDRIEAIKELVKVIPPLSDMVRFADFSAFDPVVIEKWREFYDAPGWIREPMKLVGIEGDWADKYWFSHWRQPGRFELGEMHRRELIDDDTVKMAYLTMGYSEFWQDSLLKLVKEPWTRVDVRRMWDMRTISEDELRKAYHMLGYYDEQLEGMILWTKVYVAFPDLIARYKNGWITEETVKSELAALGMSPERLEEMWQTKFKTAQPERVAAEKSATATEIMKAVKKELITRSEGVERLGRIGYSAEEAEFKLDVYIGVSEGSPDTYAEFVDLTEKYRLAMGLDAQLPPADLVEASKAMRYARIALAEAEEKGVKGDKLNLLFKDVKDTEYRYRQLLISWEESKKGGL